MRTVHECLLRWRQERGAAHACADATQHAGQRGRGAPVTQRRGARAPAHVPHAHRTQRAATRPSVLVAAATRATRAHAAEAGHRERSRRATTLASWPPPAAHPSARRARRHCRRRARRPRLPVGALQRPAGARTHRPRSPSAPRCALLRSAPPPPPAPSAPAPFQLSPLPFRGSHHSRPGPAAVLCVRTQSSSARAPRTTRSRVCPPAMCSLL